MLFFRTFLLIMPNLQGNHLIPSYISLQHLNKLVDFINQKQLQPSIHLNHILHMTSNLFFYENIITFKNFSYQHNQKEIKKYQFLYFLILINNMQQLLNNFSLYLFHLLTYKLNLIWQVFALILKPNINYVMYYEDDVFTYHKQYLINIIIIIINHHLYNSTIVLII